MTEGLLFLLPGASEPQLDLIICSERPFKWCFCVGVPQVLWFGEC